MTDATAATQCPTCRAIIGPGQLVHRDLVPGAVAEILQRQHPGGFHANLACARCVNQAKALHMQEMLTTRAGHLSPQAVQVIEDIRHQAFVSRDTNAELEQRLKPAEKLVDRFTGLIGSWYFTSTVLLTLTLWIGVNALFRPFAPYPIIILAAISAGLASLAALEGPIIMMSQRRQLRADRLRAEHDYQVNLKAELEIRYLDEKLDRLLAQQRQLLEEFGKRKGEL